MFFENWLRIGVLLSSLLCVKAFTGTHRGGTSTRVGRYYDLAAKKGFGKPETSSSVSQGFGNTARKDVVTPTKSLFNITKEGAGDIALTFFPTLNLNYPGIKCIHNDPPVFEIENFFDSILCDDYIYRAENNGMLIPSQTFSRDAASKRTSTTWFLKYADVPEFIFNANKLTGKPITTFEEPQVVRYGMGEQFSWYDYNKLATRT
jgi:hypothetical protein